MIPFAQMLREARISAGWSLDALAEAIGVSGPYLCHVEMRKTAPPTDARVCAIADTLGISAHDLLLASVIGRGSVLTPPPTSLANG